MMKNEYLVSICCETFNQAVYIQDTLNGFVLQQTDFPFIAVIVDDASTDGEQKVIKAFVDEQFNHNRESGFMQWETEDAYWTFAEHNENVRCHFVVVYLKKNLYLNPKKVELVRTYFQSKYIAYCEGDDYWTDPLKLQKQVDFLESHEEYSMCCTAFSQTFDGDETNKIDVVFELNDITLDSILRGRWIGTLTVIYRKELMSDLHYLFYELIGNDLPWWCHLAMKGRIKYLKDVTANYRSLRESACHFTDKKKECNFGLDAMKVREYYAMKTNKLDIVQPVFSKNSHYYLEQCYKNQWFDFPIDTLWHFVKEYGHPSGYDKLKYWGMKSKYRYEFSKAVLSMLKK